MTGVEITIEQAGPTARIIARGDLDIVTAPKLEHAATAAVASDTLALLVDLAEIRFIDSTGLRALLDITHSSRDRVEFILSPTIERLLELIGLTDRLPRGSDEQTAVHAFYSGRRPACAGFRRLSARPSLMRNCRIARRDAVPLLFVGSVTRYALTNSRRKAPKHS